jgi:hypothetical protein
MVYPKAHEIILSKKQRAILNKYARGTHTPLHLKIRAQIILKADEGKPNITIACELNIQRGTVIKWRNNWAQAALEIQHTEDDRSHKLKSIIKSALKDKYRIGKPLFFTPEQIAHIVSLACQSPIENGVPLSHWTPAALAHTAIVQGIVNSISARTVARYLSEADLKPHQYKGWLNAKIDNPEQCQQQVAIVCQVYRNSIQMESSGYHVCCTDEMTGVQALEHIHEALPMRPNQVECIEQEYKRHGTTTLIASRNVVTGEIVAPLIQFTRTETDFVKHIREVVATDPKISYIFVMDQLNTHKSETLVKCIAEQEGIPTEELGKKGVEGILKSMETRAAFLSDTTHQIRIVYTPKHSSWMNQIEIWFSILKRRLLNRRSSFSSVQDLELRIQQFIDYYNQYLAKPFCWTYANKLLVA